MGAAVALAAFTSPAWADDPAASATDLPPAHTTIASSEITADGIVSLPDLAQALPGLTVTPTWNSLTTPLMYLRGQGLEDPRDITRDSPVGIYEDGIPIARAQDLDFDLLDLDQVHLVTGPDTLLAARNSPAGTVDLVSQGPSGQLGFDSHAELGNRNAFRILSTLDTPTWAGLSAKVTVMARSIDGFVDNPVPAGLTVPVQDAQKYGQESERAGRLQLHWVPLAGVSADYVIEHSLVNSTPLYDSNPALNGKGIFGTAPFLVPYSAPTTPPTSTYRFIALPQSPAARFSQGLTLTWHASQALTIQSRTGYRTLGETDYQDYAESYGYDEFTIDKYSDLELSQQLDLSGSVLDGQLSYRVGGSYFKESGSHEAFFDLFGGQTQVDRLVGAHGQSQAGYAQLDFRPDWLGRHVELALSGRYTHDINDAVRFLSDNTNGQLESGAQGIQHDHRINPAATLTYHVTKSLSVYGQGATHYQPGGALESAPPQDFGKSPYTFQPDKELSYEAGVTSLLLKSALQVNAAVFETRYQDLQYDVPFGIVADEIDTMQDASLRGADLDLRLRGGPVVLFVRGEYLRWRIDRADVAAGSFLDPAINPASPYQVGQNVASLYAMPYAPKYSVTAGGDYLFLHLDRRDFTVHLDYAYRDDMAATPGDGPAVPGYAFDTIPATGVLDARLTLTQETDFSHHVRISLYGENVLNRKYYELAGGVGPGGIGTGLSPTSSATAAPLAGYTSRAVAWAPPPTYGISFTYEY